MAKVQYEMQRGLDLINQGYTIREEIWRQQVLFTWRWWLGLSLAVLCWVVWLIFRKRNSTDRLLFGGFFVMIISLSLDAIGIQFKAWHYLYPVIPAIPAYLPYDLSLIPVIIMTLIQVRPEMKPLTKGFIFALFTSFIGEPIFEFLNVYDPIFWKHAYSFPFYFVIYLIADFLTKRKNFDPIKE